MKQHDLDSKLSSFKRGEGERRWRERGGRHRGKEGGRGRKTDRVRQIGGIQADRGGHCGNVAVGHTHAISV